MKNIPPFYVGQKVVCIKEHNDPECELRLNNVYTVRSLWLCECGWSIDVGIKDSNILLKGDTTYCCDACDVEQNTDSWLLFCNRFKPLQELKVPMLTFEKIKEEEKEEILTLN